MGDSTKQSSIRNAEDEACARELLVLGSNRFSTNDLSNLTSSSRKLSAKLSNRIISKAKKSQNNSHNNPIAIILDDHEMASINGSHTRDHVVDDDTFTFITSDVNDNAGFPAMVEPTLNSVILTSPTPVSSVSGGPPNSAVGSMNTTTLTNSKRVILQVANNSNSDHHTGGGHPHTFCHSLDGNLTDVESDEDEEKNKDENSISLSASKAAAESSSTTLDSADPKVPQQPKHQPSSTTTTTASSSISHSSISTANEGQLEQTTIQPSTPFNKTTSASSTGGPDLTSGPTSGVLNLSSSAKQSVSSTEDFLAASTAVDENQPIDYTKKTLSSSSSSNNSSSSSLVSPTSVSATTTNPSSNRSSSRKPSGFCVENLIARSPPRDKTSSAALICNQIEISTASCSKMTTPYHPEIEENTITKLITPDVSDDEKNKKKDSIPDLVVPQDIPQIHPIGVQPKQEQEIQPKSLLFLEEENNKSLTSSSSEDVQESEKNENSSSSSSKICDEINQVSKTDQDQSPVQDPLQQPPPPSSSKSSDSKPDSKPDSKATTLEISMTETEEPPSNNELSVKEFSVVESQDTIIQAENKNLDVAVEQQIEKNEQEITKYVTKEPEQESASMPMTNFATAIVSEPPISLSISNETKENDVVVEEKINPGEPKQESSLDEKSSDNDSATSDLLSPAPKDLKEKKAVDISVSSYTKIITELPPERPPSMQSEPSLGTISEESKKSIGHPPDLSLSPLAKTDEIVKEATTKDIVTVTIEQKPMEKQNPIVVDEGTELKSKAGNPKVPSMTTPPYQATVENSNDASTIESSSAESEKVVVLSKDVEDKKFRKNKEQQNLDAQEDHSLCENVVVAKHNDDGHGVIKLIGEKNLDQPAQDLQKHVPPQPLVSIQSSFGSTEKTSENRKLVEDNDIAESTTSLKTDHHSETETTTISKEIVYFAKPVVDDRNNSNLDSKIDVKLDTENNSSLKKADNKTEEQETDVKEDEASDKVAEDISSKQQISSCSSTSAEIEKTAFNEKPMIENITHHLSESRPITANEEATKNLEKSTKMVHEESSSASKSSVEKVVAIEEKSSKSVEKESSQPIVQVDFFSSVQFSSSSSATTKDEKSKKVGENLEKEQILIEDSKPEFDSKIAEVKNVDAKEEEKSSAVAEMVSTSFSFGISFSKSIPADDASSKIVVQPEPEIKVSSVEVADQHQSPHELLLPTEPETISVPDLKEERTKKSEEKIIPHTPLEEEVKLQIDPTTLVTSVPTSAVKPEENTVVFESTTSSNLNLSTSSTDSSSVSTITEVFSSNQQQQKVQLSNDPTPLTTPLVPLQVQSVPQIATKSKPIDDYANSDTNTTKKDDNNPITNYSTSCDISSTVAATVCGVNEKEPEPTVIPLPSTLSLVTDEPLEPIVPPSPLTISSLTGIGNLNNDSQLLPSTTSIFSIPAPTVMSSGTLESLTNSGIFGTTTTGPGTDEGSSSIDNFEDEIIGKEIRPGTSPGGSLTVPNPTHLESTQFVVAAGSDQPGLHHLPAATVSPTSGVVKKEIKQETGPFVCQYCSRQYDKRQKYEIHLMFHTGETPFKCHLCGKGFRDKRKLKLHVARHTGSLPNKCHLCPRSFEGPKALQKHLLAHESERVVQPKLITNADGTTAIALPTDNGVGGHGTKGDQVIISNATATSGGAPDQVLPGGGVSVVGPPGQGSEDDQSNTISLSMDDLMQYAQPVPDNVITEENGLEDKIAGGSATTKFVTLGMDEFIQHESQHGQQQPAQHHQPLVASKSLPISGSDIPDISGDLHNDSGEFPDLLDSESNLESLSSYAVSSRPSKSGLHEDQESGLTFATLSGVKPVYPESAAAISKVNVQSPENMVVARKSTAPGVVSAMAKVMGTPGTSGSNNPAEITANASGANPTTQETQLKPDDLNEAISQLTKSQIKLPPGTCLVPADAKCEQVLAPDQAQLEMIGSALQNSNINLQGDQNNPMIITIQYKVYPDAQGGEPQKVAVQRNLAEIISEAPNEMAGATATTSASGTTATDQANASNSLGSTPVATPTPPIQSKSTTKVKPIGVDMEPSELPAIPVAPPTGPDPSKDTMKVISASGKEFDVPTIVTSGYDLDKLLCTFCNKVFKNDKTLMSHMLHHFGVTPKMASCPICGLTLQKKSYARHLRLHGNVVPEVCQYCQKEFREKRSMDKHIKAIHQAERPYICPIPDCAETFRNQVELKNHHNRHIKDYPYECDRCPMTFQKQDSLTTHYRSHTGEKPFVCEICDKSFTSEKNKKVHVQRHQGSLPHKCDVCSMTFQSRSHLIKHATSHNRQGVVRNVQITDDNPTGGTSSSNNKINNFLESFTASLGDDMLGGMDDQYSSETITGDDAKLHDGDGNSVRLSVDTISESLEAAAAEAALAFGQHDSITEDLLRTSEQGDLQQQQHHVITTSGGQITITNSAMAAAKHSGMPSLKCKFCEMILQGQQNFNKHIRTNHNIDPNTVQPIVVEDDLDQIKDAESSQSSESFKHHSGRGSVASNFEHSVSGSGIVQDTMVKCGWVGCPDVFSSHELLQKHTLTHFASASAEAEADDMSGSKADENSLREKLLKQTMRSKKKKKKNKAGKLSMSASQPEGGNLSGITKPKFKKSYSCLLCDTVFIKKESWRIHKIGRHNGKGWKCKFCKDVLFETSDALRDHLVTVHTMSTEDIDEFKILKDANMFVVTKKLKTSIKKSDSSSDESDTDGSEGDLDDVDDDDEVDFDDDDEEEEDDQTTSTTNASTPTPNFLSAIPPTTLPDVLVTAHTPVNHMIQSSSPTPSTSSGSGLPSLKFIEDESLFDLDALTCHACNKSFKNTRAFKLHRDRHQGALKHKCPECIKTFNGRSEVNRHMVAIHGRHLGNDEDTLHKKAETMQAQQKHNKHVSPIQKVIPTQVQNLHHPIPIEMNMTLPTTDASTIFAAPLETIPMTTSMPLTSTSDLSSLSTSQFVEALTPTVTTSVSGTSSTPSIAALTSASPAVMSLASNQFDSNLATTSTINVSQSGIILTSTTPSVSSSMPIIQGQKPVITSPTAILDMPSLMEPEPVAPPQPQLPQPQEVVVKQQFDITSIQQPDPSVLKDHASSVSAVGLKPSSSQMMIPQLPELSDIPTSVQKLAKEQTEVDKSQVFHQNIKKNVEKDEATAKTDIGISTTYAPVPPEKLPQKDGKLVEKEAELSDFDLLKAELSNIKDNNKSSAPVVTKVEEKIVHEQPPNKHISSKVLEEKIPPNVESKQKQKADDQKDIDKISVVDDSIVNTEEPACGSALDEDQLDISNEDNLPRRRGRSSQTATSVSADNAKPRNTRGSSGSPMKSNSPTDENSPKKRRGRPKRTPEPSTSEDSSQEKEKENSASSAALPASTTSTTSKSSSDENKKQKLLKQKGVTVNKEGKVMIPSHKITLSDELCQIVEGKKGKKLYECQICSKKFNRKDTINYHVYIEHREEFLEFGKGLPDVLTREETDDDQPPTKSKSNNAAAAVFKRIFAPKLKSGNNTDRKGQVEIEIKSKSDKKDEVDEDEMRVSQQLPRIKDHQKIHHSSNKKDYYSEKVDKKSDLGGRIIKTTAEHAKPSTVDDKKIHGKARVKEEKKSKQSEDIFDSLLDPNDVVQEEKSKVLNLEKSLNKEMIVEKTADELPPATSPPVSTKTTKKRTSRSSRNVADESQSSSTRSSSRNVPEEQQTSPTKRSSTRNILEEHTPSQVKEDLVPEKESISSSQEKVVKTAVGALATSPNITKATKKRSSRNAPEENHPSADFPEKDVESSSEEKVAKPTAMVELAPSPPPTKAKKRTSRSSRNVPPEESHHPSSTKKLTDLNLEPSETSSKTTNRTTSVTEESSIKNKKGDFPLKSTKKEKKSQVETVPDDEDIDSFAIHQHPSLPLGRRGRKPKVPKKIPQDDEPEMELVKAEESQVELNPPAPRVLVGKRTRGSSKKSESEPSTSSAAMEEIPLVTSPEKLDKEEKPLKVTPEIESRTGSKQTADRKLSRTVAEEKSNVVNTESYKKILPSRNKSSPEKPPPRVVLEKASTSPKSKTSSSSIMDFGNPIVLIEKTPPHEVTKLTSPRRELLQDEQPVVEDQEAGNSRRRRRSAKNQKPIVSEKEESSQVKAVKPVQVMEKEVKKISDENLHPVTIEAEIEDMGKEKKENIDATSVSGFKGKKRTSRTSRTIPEETLKDTSTIMNPDAKEVLINAGDTEKTPKRSGRGRKKAILDLLESLSTPSNEPTTSVSGIYSIVESESEPSPQKTETVKKSVEEQPELKMIESNAITTAPEKEVKRRGRKKLADVIQKLEPELATTVADILIRDAIPEKTLQITKSSIVVANREKLEKSPSATFLEKEVESSPQDKKLIKPAKGGRKKVSEILEKLSKEKLSSLENNQPSPAKLNEKSKPDDKPEINVTGQKWKSGFSSGGGSGSGGPKSKELLDEKCQRETGIVEPEEENQDIDITKTIGGQIGRTAKKIRTMQKHVNLLLEYQEQQKRFRNRSLLDSQDALNILKKYRRKRPRIFSASSSTTNTNLVLKFKREHRKPYHAMEKNLKNPFKFKLVKKPPTLVVEPKQSKQEKQQQQSQVLEPVAVPAHQALASAKKRGRPSKKPSSALDDSNIKDEPELPNIASKLDNTKTKRVKISEDQENEENKPIKSPSPKRRMMSGTGNKSGTTGSGPKSDDKNEVEEDKPIKSPSPPKRRILSSPSLQATTTIIASSSTVVKDVTSITSGTSTSVSGGAEFRDNTPTLAGIKKRGRPPKKAYIAEMEEQEAENARKKEIHNEKIENNATIKMPLEDVVTAPVPEKEESLQEKVVKPAVAAAKSSTNIIHNPIMAAEVKTNENVIIGNIFKESEKIAPRKRGRPKKTDDKIVEEEESEVDYHQIPAKKRVISRENALIINEPPPTRAVPSNKEVLIPPPQTNTFKGSKSEEQVTKAVEKHKNFVEQVVEEKTSSKSTEKSSQDKKVIEKMKSELHSTNNEVNDNKYTIQKSTNPLKFKLKTGKELQNDDNTSGKPSSGGIQKVPLKLKLSLKGSSDSADQEILKKKKKKKKHHKAEKNALSDAEKPHVILKIKSPTRGFGGSNNGFVIKNDTKILVKSPQQHNNTKHLVKSPIQDVSESDLQRATSSGSGDIQAPAISFSPESSPEHVPTRNFPFLAGTTKSNITDQIGLGEGQFNDLMKGLEDSDEELKNNAKSMPQKSSSTSSSVKQSQVDGTIDSWSRSSSISQDSPIHLMEDIIGNDSNDGNVVDHNNIPEIDYDKKCQGVIHKRMKQIQGHNRSPKTKSCLIKHVFSAVAKKRKIVVVRYKKPERRIFDLEEFFERCDQNRLDEAYDEDTDDPTMKPNRSSSKASVIKTSSATSFEVESTSFEKPSASMVEDEEYWRDDPEYLQSLDSLVCFQCQRTLPNVVRMHAHLQMHHEAKNSKKIQRRMSKDFTVVDQDPDRIVQLDGETNLLLDDDATVYEDQDRIVQLDGETDLLLDDDGNLMNQPRAGTSTSSSSLSGSGANSGAGVSNNSSGGGNTPGSGPTQLFILKSTGQDDKVYQCPQCPEVFPGQKALLTHQSLVHRNSQTSTIFPCQHCSIGFKDAKSLDLHVRLEHGKQQIVTIIQADLQRETGSTGSSFGSSSSSCSSSTTSSHPSSTSSGHFSMQSESANGEGSSSHHPLLMKQDPVLMFNSDEEQDLMLDESLNLFETSSLIDSGDSAIHLSLDDLASFAQPMVNTDGSHTSFDTSIETSSFLSGTDALDIINESNNTPMQMEVGGNGNRNGESRTPSISDDGEFPCTQCEKRFGNRRNLLSHMRRHTGDFKLFCDHCSKGFFTQSKLESHKRKHTGEKPFRCLLKSCLKRFRYKGDLSKHIKKYHPGHTQELTPVPPQEDELLNLQNQSSVATGTFKTLQPSATATTASAARSIATSSQHNQQGSTTTIVVSNTGSGGSSGGTSSNSGSDNKFFLPLLPRHPVQQEELMASGFSKDLVNDNDPSLDDNILDLLTEDDSPILSLSPGPSLPPPPPPQQQLQQRQQQPQQQLPPPSMPPPSRTQSSSSSSTTTIVSSKLHEVLTQGRPKPSHHLHNTSSSNTATEAFVVPTSAHTFKPANKQQTTHIVNLAGNTYKTIGNTKPLAISISQVFACAQPLPLQEDAKHQSKGKMTTMADLDARSASSVLSANAAFVQGLVNAKKTGATIIATSGSGGNIFRTASGQQVSIIRSTPAIASTSTSNPNVTTLVNTSGSGNGGAVAGAIVRPTKAFVCDFKGCNKSFEKASFLKRHAKLHSSNCKFVCDVCTKCFESQSKLDDHYRKHTGAKPFICHICSNAFRYKGDRTKHLKNIHGVMKTTNTSNSTNTNNESSALNNSGNGSNIINHRASPFIVEDTSSSISSFQSTSDQSSLAGSLVESPTKTEPIESNRFELMNPNMNTTETVTMTLEEISQFAQNIY